MPRHYFMRSTERGCALPKTAGLTLHAGLTLQEALCQEPEIATPSFPPVGALRAVFVQEARRQVERRLTSLFDRLESGESRTTGYRHPVAPDSNREEIRPALWAVLRQSVDVKASTASGAGLAYSGIRVFPPRAAASKRGRPTGTSRIPKSERESFLDELEARMKKTGLGAEATAKDMLRPRYPNSNVQVGARQAANWRHERHRSGIRPI